MRAILMFHSVDTSRSVLSIAPEELVSLVRSIRRAKHRIVPLASLLDEPGRPRQIALTFDDGIASIHENALTLLREEGAAATLFLVTDAVGRDNRWPGMPESAPTMPMMNWEQLEELRAAGWAIEAHTGSHPDLRSLADDEIRRQLELANAALADHLGHRPTIFAYPYGFWDERVEAVVSKYYRFSLTTDMKRLPRQIRAPHRIPRLETYYFRLPAIHRRFGSPEFAIYLRSRALLRRLHAR